jgi:hypothetical protein
MCSLEAKGQLFGFIRMEGNESTIDLVIDKKKTF